MADMRASVVKGVKLSIIAQDYQDAQGQSAAFQSQGSPWFSKLRRAVQVDEGFAVAETPALRIERFGSGRHAEDALKESAIQEFDGHGTSKGFIFKGGYFEKGLNQAG